ncbi:T9SS type A sorting domain-containing protein [Pontibacter vulgaris]|uniref:T9SS type A sorting domain-containing protein n=1 Tax=Pontibacter vulgaris TaxID=2905679 RepID=UPI001FA72EFB|nr:T9SS type A sorting domain-containing protein [Pontibacter vulgaris]
MDVATDGQVTGGGGSDKFRIKIWKSGGDVVYDNEKGTAENADLSSTAILGGGSIVIHEVVKATGSGKFISETISKPEPGTSEFYNYPNAFSDRTTIAFSLEKEESFVLEVFDVRGALIKKVDMGVAEKGKLYEYELDARSMAEGIYFARLSTTAGTKTLKMLLKK